MKFQAVVLFAALFAGVASARDLLSSNHDGHGGRGGGRGRGKTLPLNYITLIRSGESIHHGVRHTISIQLSE